MPRAKSPQAAIEAAIAQLDKLLADKNASPSAIKACETKLTILHETAERLDRNRQSALGRKVAELEERLKAFDGVDPRAVSTLTEENKTLRVQLENVRANSQSTATERDTARQALTNRETVLRWLAGRVQDTRRLVVAIDCFVAHVKDSQPLVDALLGVGTCQEWLRLSSKQRLIERYKELRNAREPADQKLREFCRLYLASKHAFDVDEELRKAAEATRKQEAEEEHRHEQERQARELAADAMRQSQAMDDMIRAVEAGYYNRPAARAVRSDLEW